MIIDAAQSDQIARDLQLELPENRWLHVLGVVQAATSLATRLGFDVDKVYAAALLHDCAKSLDKDELLRRRDAGDFALDEEDLEYPAIWHGPAGAGVARARYGIDDEEVLEAIRHHTLGLPSPSPTLRVLMAADATEPTRDYPGVDDLRKLLRSDFKAGLVEVVRHKVADLHARGRKPHSRIFGTLTYLEQE